MEHILFKHRDGDSSSHDSHPLASPDVIALVAVSVSVVDEIAAKTRGLPLPESRTCQLPSI